MVFVYHSLYDIPGLASLMKVLYRGSRDSPILYAMERLKSLGSLMVGLGILLNNMKSSSPEY